MSLAEVLVKIPSLSPNTSIRLLELSIDLKKKAAEVEDPEIKEQLNKFSDALRVVCDYSKIHQKAVIDTFENLVKNMKAKKDG